MWIVTDLESFRCPPHSVGGSASGGDSRPLFLALGNFDGVHLGHQALLKRVVGSTKAGKGTAAVFSFQEHPHRILHPEKKLSLLTSLEQRLFLLKEFRIHLCFLLPFTEAFSKMEAEAFVRDILVKRLGVCEVLMGARARFGHDRQGDTALMKKLSGELGFRFQEVGEVVVEGQEVSSSRIRELLKQGDLDTARLCLGRPYSVLGEVVSGEARGKQLGFPTANLKSRTEPLIPQGVYAVRVREIGSLSSPNVFSTTKRGGSAAIFGESGNDSKTWGEDMKAGPWLGGALNYGLRPTFGKDRSLPVVEVFILDFQGELYGKTLEVAFLRKIRNEKNFSSPEALKAQIGQDIEDCRRFFES